MQYFISTLPGIIASVGAVIVVVVIGALYVAGLFKQKKDDADDRLIKILQETVGELEKKVDKLEKREGELTKEVGELRSENRKYLEILQGRDQQTQKFYEAAFESMKVSKETHAIVAGLATSMSDTNTNITKLIELLSKHTDVIDHAVSGVK